MADVTFLLAGLAIVMVPRLLMIMAGAMPARDPHHAWLIRAP